MNTVFMLKSGKRFATGPRRDGKGLTGNLFGGLASMLVALPSAIAFGLLVYAPLGPSCATMGVMAGIIGTVVLGIVASVFGGAPRLISAPCAPAAAVMGALAASLAALASKDVPPHVIPMILLLVAFAAGMFQFFFGMLGGGRLIKYIPFPVIAGYLSAVGILIFTSQCPKFLGTPKDTAFLQALTSPGLWDVPSIVVGFSAMVVMVFAVRLTRAVPAPILALAVGMGAYFGLACLHQELWSLEGNRFVIGPMAGGCAEFGESVRERWAVLARFGPQHVLLLLGPALTLSVLLSIDTLKTAVILDVLTRSRHNSNRELMGQGLGNMASAVAGGMPGAGTMGPTLINITSGGNTRLSGVLCGVFALAAFLLFGRFMAWIPLAALAGILMVVACKMIDRESLHLLRRREGILDFLVIVAVVVTAVAYSLVAAAGVGLALAALLFLREQIRGSVVRRKFHGNEMFSKKRRLPSEVAILEKRGGETVVLELQGPLFFGTTDQLLSDILPLPAACRNVILDLQRISAIDFTAVHLLRQIEDEITDKGGHLLFCNLPDSLPSGQKVDIYLEHMGVFRATSNVVVLQELDEALEWAEEDLLREEGLGMAAEEGPLDLADIHILSGLSAGTLDALRPCVREQTVEAGERIFATGDSGDELYLISQGSVRILLILKGERRSHLVSFGRGDFFGEVAFLDRGTRSADAVATTKCRLYVLSRAVFDRLVQADPAVAARIFENMAKVMAERLRHTDIELQALHGS